MHKITGFRLRGRARTDALQPESDIDTAARGAVALELVKEKIEALAPRFFSMNDDEFGEWLNGLPRDEFVELIGLGNEGIARIITQARREPGRRWSAA